VGQAAFFDATGTRFAADFEANVAAIQAELGPLLKSLDQIPNFQDIQSTQAALTRDNKWKTFVLLAYGEWLRYNASLCPRTSALIRKYPEITSAMFSILLPHKHLPPHEGPVSGVLRYHLGLVIPKATKLCAVKVNGETRHWEAGKSLVFDDTFTHEAWNHSDEIRVVLFVDFKRRLPLHLRIPCALLFSLLRHSPFIQETVEKINEKPMGAP
jgi:aspartyl/asparaginyl beta-hydroxylase (cupin superfamily)